MKIKVGNGFDVHKFRAGNFVTLGGVEIEADYALEAHSDGDVLIHAVCDALLGALSLGDIGAHFPDTDDAFKGIDSCILLQKCCQEVTSRGYKISNIDATVMAQTPKLRPHIDTIRKRLAEVIGIDVEDISVKATTTEKLGFVGRKEGIAVLATTLIYK